MLYSQSEKEMIPICPPLFLDPSVLSSIPRTPVFSLAFVILLDLRQLSMEVVNHRVEAIVYSISDFLHHLLMKFVQEALAQAN
jgi:hypothetical protein